MMHYEHYGYTAAALSAGKEANIEMQIRLPRQQPATIEGQDSDLGRRCSYTSFDLFSFFNRSSYHSPASLPTDNRDCMMHKNYRSGWLQ